MRFTKYLCGVVIALSALLIQSGVANAQVKLRMMTFVPPVANPAKTFLAPWADKVEKASGGKIKIERYWAMALGGKAPQLLDQIRDGVVDIGWTLPGFTPGRFPQIEPFELPFVHRDALSTTLALQDFYDKYLTSTFKDYKVLLIHVHDGFFFQTKFPVKGVADIKGRKIRAASRAGVWLLNELGAKGIGMPLPRIPQALSKGVIEGVTLPYEIAPAVKTPDLVSHFATLSGEQPRLGTNVFTFLMNKAKYDGLTDELKKVIDDHSGRNIARWAGENWRAVEEPGKKAVMARKKNKITVISTSETEKMKAAADAVYARWFQEAQKANLDGPSMLKDAKTMIAEHAK
ncbi:MAG: TRAP transporter substrate-binding protein [Hyphomicrobiaceae bacterium]